MSVIIEERNINVEEYLRLRATTNWTQFAAEEVKNALAKDLFSVCASVNGEVIGIGRVIGDGSIYFYIQDVIVSKEYQGKGIGKKIMFAIENFLALNANEGSFVGLMSAEGYEGFYRQFSYRPRADQASGMYKIIFGNRQDV